MILDKCRQIIDTESGRVLLYRDEVEAVLTAGDTISRRHAVEAVKNYWKAEVDAIPKDADFVIVTATCDMILKFNEELCRVLDQLPSAQPEWNNHTVACLLAEMFGEDCACNFNGIDEWLPEKCEVIESCPNPVGVACWEQFLKHRGERRQDE